MKILVICQYYYPEQFRINDICESLVKEGHEITVLTGLPNYPDGVIPAEYKGFKRRKEKRNGVNIIRVTEIPRGKGKVKLALNYASFMISATLKVLRMKKDFDQIFVYQLSPVTMALPGVIAKKLSKKPLYLYSCDIWPESMKNLISNEQHVLYRVIKKFSTYLYSHCDGIGITSKPFKKYFNEVHKIPEQNISYIPQHAEEEYLKIQQPQNNGIIDFMFMGNIGIIQDIDCILMAVNEIKDVPNFKVHFVGDGSYINEAKDFVKTKQIEHLVEFYGRHPLEKMPDFYNIADVCLITLKNESLVGLTMPSKLQGYMAAGRAVLGAIDGSAKDVIEDANGGICVAASDYKALSNAMKEMIENKDALPKYGENNRKYFVNNFTKQIYIDKLVQQFETMQEEK